MLCLSRSRGLAPARALPYPRLLPIGPASPSCSVSAVPLAWLSTAAPPAPSPVAAPAPQHLLPVLLSLRARLARPAVQTFSAPRAAAADPSASAAWLARQRGSSNAAETEKHTRDQRRRRTRRHSKRSAWREIQLQSLAGLAMWACCDDTSSDDNEHNTSNAFLLLCADAPHRSCAAGQAHRRG